MLSTLKRLAKRALGRTDPEPALVGEAGPGWYDDAYKAIESYRAEFNFSHYYFLWCVIADRIRRDKLRRVYEIGCGPGQFAAYLFHLGIDDYLGLDFSEQAIAMARQMCPQGKFVVDDARTTNAHLDFPHDVVVCTEVLEHVEDDSAVLNQIAPGTRCLCTVPNFPFDSHVRHFESADEVAERYGEFFDDFDVLALKGYESRNNVYFLMDGIKRYS